MDCGSTTIMTSCGYIYRGSSYTVPATSAEITRFITLPGAPIVAVKDAVHAPPQLIPEGELETVPVPAPDFKRVN